MSLGKGFLVIGVASLALLTRLVLAGEPSDAVPAAAKDAKPAAASQAAVADDGSMAQLIGQLDAEEFDARETASAKLAAKGKAAIAALEKAAANGNLEVSSRATTILGKLLKSSDEATQKAANQALQHLADGDSPAAARKAKSILEKKNGLKNPGQGQGVIMGNGFGGQIIINGGQLNIGGGGAMKTMSVKNVNGVKETTATEDGKTVKIQDDPAQGIKIELTEKQNGKEVTKKYEAKNAEELKKKQPAGYELYKKYSGEQPGVGAVQMQFQIQAGGIQGNVIPVLPGVVPAPAPPIAVLQANPQLQVATMQIKNLSSELERLQKAEACKNASPESKAELKKQINELSKRLDDLRGQLGDK